LAVLVTRLGDGGLTSIDGNQSISFSDFVRQGFGGKNLPQNLLIAETFLARDTRTKDAAGKDIVEIFGGLKWAGACTAWRKARQHAAPGPAKSGPAATEQVLPQRD
jgi:hypothetical protein